MRLAPPSSLGSSIKSEVSQEKRISRLIEENEFYKSEYSRILENISRYEVVTKAISLYLETENWHSASKFILQKALIKTKSEYGFIGVIHEEALRVLAFEGIKHATGVSKKFNEANQKIFQKQGYIEFNHFDNLFGAAILEKQTIISNTPQTDKRAKHTRPVGHPDLNAFLGVPIFNKGDVIGMIGLANRANGYTVTEQETIEILTYAAGVLYDSYRRKIVADENSVKLAKYKEQLSNYQQLSLFGEMTAGIAHELNQPMSSITNYAKGLIVRLQNENIDQDAVLEIINKIASLSIKSSQIIHHVRSAYQVGRIEKVKLNLNACIERAINSVYIPDVIDVKKELALDLKYVFADEIQIELVVINLLRNAVDAVAHSSQPDKYIKINTKNITDDLISISIEDNGIGFSKEHESEIFEPLFSTKKGGIGVGLSLCKTIILAHDGHIAGHHQNSITEFVINLPIGN